MLRLYGNVASGHSYEIRLYLLLAGIERCPAGCTPTRPWDRMLQGDRRQETARCWAGTPAVAR